MKRSAGIAGLMVMLAGVAVAQSGEGWTLRATPDGAKLALAAGPGGVREVVAFCLSGEPWIALRFDPEPDASKLAIGFDFTEGPLSVEAQREPSAGDAYVIELDGLDLASRLSGRDAAVALSVDGESLGALTLRGSTRAIRAALRDCHAF